MTRSSEARFPLRIDWERVMALPEWQRVASLADSDPPPASHPLKVDWDLLHPAAAEEYPAPHYTSRDGAPVKLPSAVDRLAQFARERRWEVIAQSSMGSVPHSRTGRPSALKRLAALRFGNHPSGRRAYVVYEAPAVADTWKPRSIMIWGPDLPPYGHVGMNDFRDYLSKTANLNEAQLKHWVAVIEKLRQASEAHQKRRMTVRRQIIKVSDEGRFAAAREEDRKEWERVDAEWRGKVKDLQDGVFTSEEVAVMIDPDRRRKSAREAL